MKFKLNYKQYSDFVNLTNNVFYPLKNFVNKQEFNSILQKQKIKNKFFPFPIFFSLKKNQFDKIKDKENLTFVYKSKNIAIVNKLEFFSINSDLFGKKIFGKRFKEHPYYKMIIKENYFFLNFNITKKFKYKIKSEDFVSPLNFKKKFKNIKYLASFHTRNVPHNAHQWIHRLLLKKFGSLLIHPLVGQYKKGEYKGATIMKTNIKASKVLKNKKVFCLPFLSYPRYGGPLEAALHAIVRRNYGCTHFWVGRDHAGYKDFFSLYQSQNYCKKKQQKLAIGIICEKEPFFCKTHNTITNKCKNIDCEKNKILISGTKIRKYLLSKKKIPTHLMSKNISTLINSTSLIQ
jgi:sulfate adenylyltransferase